MPFSVNVGQAEAERRTEAHRGYVLLGPYLQRDIPVLVRCPVHNHEQRARPAGLWRGGMLSCCNRIAKSERMQNAMAGAGNNFFGKRHTAVAKERMSRAKCAAPHPFRGKARPEYLTQALASALTGAPRAEAVKAAIGEQVRRRHGQFDYCLRVVSAGKTVGKQGVFYVVRLPDGTLKMGSTTKTMSYRLARLRQKHGVATQLLLHSVVPDAGRYEAAMMEHHRQHWIRGERFHDWFAAAS